MLSKEDNTSLKGFKYITIKIRFSCGRKVEIEGEEDTLNAAVFVIIKIEGNLRCEMVAYMLETGGKTFFDLETITLT